MSSSTAHPRLVSLLAVLLAGFVGVAVLPPPAVAATVEVRITSTLEPATVAVTPGTTVTWVNADAERHRIRATSGPEELDSGNLEPGERFSHTFTTQGTTSYVDGRDPDAGAYHGRVVVAEEPAPDATAAPSGPETVTVSMAGRRFSPPAVSITTGDTVRFLNDDDRDHTATADDGSFDSGLLAAGQAWERTFTVPGTFSYLCLLHPDMVGTVAVADAGETAPPPAPAPAPSPAPAPTTAPSPPAAGGTGGAAPTQVEVELRDFSFAPAALEVVLGSTVTFRNTGRALHTATADDGSFDSDLVAPGGVWEHRVDRVGTFAYTCLLHPEMVGTLTVVAGSSGAGDGPGTATGPAPGPTTDGADPAVTPPPRPRPPGSVLVSLQDFSFAPATIDLRVGDTVRFRNDGRALHTATARDGSYDSGLLRAGEVADRTFRTAGTFDYWCTLHPDMVATIRVASADGSVPAAAPTPADAAADGDEGQEAGSTAAVSDDASATVSVVDDDFLPGVLEVVIGEEVVWTNDGRAVHTITADDGSFDSGIIAAGAVFRHRFERLGTFAYTCIVHPGMAGEVRVVAAADELVPAPAAAADGGPVGPSAGPGRLSTASLEVLLLAVFAGALALFTAVARHVGSRGGAAG